MPALVARASQKLSEHGRRNRENWCFQVATTLEKSDPISSSQWIVGRVPLTTPPRRRARARRRPTTRFISLRWTAGFRGACERPVVSGLDVVSVWIEHECGLVSRRVGIALPFVVEPVADRGARRKDRHRKRSAAAQRSAGRPRRPRGWVAALWQAAGAVSASTAVFSGRFSNALRRPRTPRGIG